MTPASRVAALLPFLFAVVPVAGQESARIDPSRPTNLYSSVGTGIAWTGFELSDAWALQFGAGWSPSRRNRIRLEVPLRYVTFPGVENETGLGDVRVGYFGLPLVRKGLLSHVGTLIDVALPSGDERRGLGSGATILAPGLIFGLTATGSLSFYPTLRLQYSSSVPNCTTDGAEAVACVTTGPGQADDRRTTAGWSLELPIVSALPPGRWLQLIPKYAERTRGPESTSLSLRLDYGMMLGDNLAFRIDLLHEFDNGSVLENHVRLGLEFFF